MCSRRKSFAQFGNIGDFKQGEIYAFYSDDAKRNKAAHLFNEMWVNNINKREAVDEHGKWVLVNDKKDNINMVISRFYLRNAKDDLFKFDFIGHRPRAHLSSNSQFTSNSQHKLGSVWDLFVLIFINETFT